MILKQKFILLFGLLLSTLCVVTCSTDETYKFIEVRENGTLAEKIYYKASRGNPLATSRVFFRKDKHMPLDSLVYNYDEQGNRQKIVHYNYRNGKYKKQEFTFTNDFPLHCQVLNDIKFTKKFLRKELSDLCIVTAAILSNGNAVITKKGEIQISKYQNLNAQFRNLSLEINEFFYNQILKSVVIRTSKNRLLSEIFKFEKGMLKRNYSYKEGHMTVDITAAYNDRSTKKVAKNYIIHLL